MGPLHLNWSRSFASFLGGLGSATFLRSQSYSSMVNNSTGCRLLALIPPASGYAVNYKMEEPAFVWEFKQDIGEFKRMGWINSTRTRCCASNPAAPQQSQIWGKRGF
eukprot:4946440-Amphidinium_carterae.1